MCMCFQVIRCDGGGVLSPPNLMMVAIGVIDKGGRMASRPESSYRVSKRNASYSTTVIHLARLTRNQSDELRVNQKYLCCAIKTSHGLSRFCEPIKHKRRRASND